MFDLHLALSVLFVLLTLWANGRYLISALQGKTVPHFVTWLALGILAVLAGILQVQAGARIGAIPMFMAAAMNFSICIAGFLGWYRHLRHETSNGQLIKTQYVTKTDYAAGLAALVAVALWQSTDNPVAAVLLLSVASLLAFWPTIRRSWTAPNLELLFTYKLSTIRYLVAVLAVEQFSFVTVFYPAVWVAVNASFTALLISRRRRLAVPVAAST